MLGNESFTSFYSIDQFNVIFHYEWRLEIILPNLASTAIMNETTSLIKLLSWINLMMNKA